MALRQVIQQKMSDVAPQVLEECSTSPVFAQMGRSTAPSSTGTHHISPSTHLGMPTRRHTFDSWRVRVPTGGVVVACGAGMLLGEHEHKLMSTLQSAQQVKTATLLAPQRDQGTSSSG